MSLVAAPIVGQDSPSCVRLYISPFNPAVLDSILAPPTRVLARNLSFHSIDTYPEKNYGYLELPIIEAQTLRRKLNGSFVKGMKLRVEDARPDKKKRKAFESVAEAQQEASLQSNIPPHGAKEVRARKRPRQDKHAEGVLSAVELSGDRQVKRGWVQNAAEENRKKSKKTRDAEGKEKPDRSQMIFRTNLPPTIASANISKNKQATKTGKHHKKSRSAEVKEFTRTTKYPTFLKSMQPSANTRTTSVYIDGKGWMDEDGNVIEAATTGKERKYQSHVDTPSPSAVPMREDSALVVDGNTLPVGSENHDSEGIEQSEDARSSLSGTTGHSGAINTGDTGSYQTSPSQYTIANKQPVAGDLPSLSPTEETSISATIVPPKAIHPLEALFKRPNPALSQNSASSMTTLSRPNVRPAPIVTSFSFFDTTSNNDLNVAKEDVDAEEDEENADAHGAFANPPQTPFTRRDLEARGQRSAAPTPDTAAVDKRLRVPWLSSGVDEDDGVDDNDYATGNQHRSFVQHEHDEEDNSFDLDPKPSSQTEPVTASPGEGPTASGEQTEFEKQFWANRGEYNRAWKARKREARKEARQAENRRVSRLR